MSFLLKSSLFLFAFYKQYIREMYIVYTGRESDKREAVRASRGIFDDFNAVLCIYVSCPSYSPSKRRLYAWYIPKV